MSNIGLIVDVAVIVVLLLLILFGTWRGLYKLIYGVVSGLLSIVLAVVLVGMVTTFIVNKTELETKLGEKLNETIVKALPAELDAENVHIEYSDEGFAVTNKEGESFESVSAYVSSTGSKLSAVAGILDSLTSNETVRNSYATTDESGTTTYATPTLADLLCVTATIYLLLAIVFLVLWIVAFIVLRLLMLLMKKIVTQTYVGHFLNKALGFVLGAAVGLVLVWGALAVIRLLGTYTWIIPVNNVINGSTLTKWLYENNFLYTFLVETMNLQDTIANLVGSFSAMGGGAAEPAAEAAAALS